MWATLENPPLEGSLTTVRRSVWAIVQLVSEQRYSTNYVALPSFLSFDICYILNSSKFCKHSLQNLEELECSKDKIK